MTPETLSEAITFCSKDNCAMCPISLLTGTECDFVIWVLSVLENL